jgi:hypothetical protein
MSSRKALIVVTVIATLILVAALWVFMPGVSFSFEGSIRLSFEDQKGILEKLNLSGRDSFYTLALTTCPWCALQLNFFNKEFPGAYGYCYIDVSVWCREVLEKLTLESGGLIAGVPTTLIIKDGRITAIVVGYRGDRSFWEQAMKLEPSEDIPVNPIGLNPQIRVKVALSITILALGAILALTLYTYKGGRRGRGRGRG